MLGLFFYYFCNRMIKQRQLLDCKDISITIDRLCHQLIERHTDFLNTVLVGIQPRGTFLCNRIIKNLNKHNCNIKSGNIDISFYRDDLRRRSEPIVPEAMDMNVVVEDKNIVLIDDVLYTGRSVRSAMDALMNFGRPKSVELLILINRRFSRDFPIQADYIGKNVDV